MPPEAFGAGDGLPKVAEVEADVPEGGGVQLPRTGWSWAWNGDRATLQGGDVAAHVECTEPGRYVAHGLETDHAADFLTCLVWPALLREGGLLLHACAVELSGRAVLFVGPSGAGKSTAAVQTTGARLLARDVTAVFPARGTWWAAAMPGGTDPATPMRACAERCLPLAGLLRVVKAHGESAVDVARGADALALTMAAVRHAGASRGDHQVLLSSAYRLSCEVAVGRLQSVLGADTAPTLTRWLEGHSD